MTTETQTRSKPAKRAGRRPLEYAVRYGDRPEPYDIEGAAERCGLALQTFRNYQARGQAPMPDFYISGCPGWWPETIEEWDRTRRRIGPVKAAVKVPVQELPPEAKPKEVKPTKAAQVDTVGAGGSL